MPHEHGALATRIIGGDSIAPVGGSSVVQVVVDRDESYGHRDRSDSRAGGLAIRAFRGATDRARPAMDEPDRPRSECCLVLLAGQCRVIFGDRVETLGPRASVFAGYPHALYLPPGTAFRVEADEPTEAGGRPRARDRARDRAPRGPRDSARETAASRFAAAATPRGRSSTSSRRIFRPIGCWFARSLHRPATGPAIRRTSTTSIGRQAK